MHWPARSDFEHQPVNWFSFATPLLLLAVAIAVLLRRRHELRAYGENLAEIDTIATKSSQTGAAYLVRLPNGKTTPAGPWLKRQAAGRARK